MMTTNKNIGILILAAGGSSRLGKPKQLLDINGQYFIQHFINVATVFNPHSIAIVLGAEAEKIAGKITITEKISIIKNENWHEGMSTSLQSGIDYFVNLQHDIDNIIILLCDQPYVTTTHLQNLISKYEETQSPIIACNYGETFGPPVLIHKSFFPKLQELKGDEGAKKIINKNLDQVSFIEFEKGLIDIDTEGDYGEYVGSL